MKNNTVLYFYADLINSRKIKDRQAFNKVLKTTISSLQNLYKTSIDGEIQKWKGIDEIAAVIKDAAIIPGVFMLLNLSLRPEKWRLVLVKGEVLKSKKSTSITEMDGDVFVKASNLMLKLIKTNLCFAVDTDQVANDTNFTNQMLLLNSIKSNWTLTQQKIYETHILGKSQKEVANSMKISIQSVSKTLKTIDAAVLQKVEKELTQWIKGTY